MTAFAAQLDRLDLSAYSFAPGRKEAHVPLGGVTVSVRPELLITGDAPGAFKIYLGKSSPLTENEGARVGSGTYAATVLHMWAEAEFGAKHGQCIVLDVFAGEFFTAPARTLRRRQEVLANCREIAIMWTSLEPGGGPPSGHGRPRATGAA